MPNEVLRSLEQELVQLRRHLHANPEVSGEEFKTAETVYEYLKANIDAKIHYPVGKTGLIVEYDSGNPGKSVMIRGDMDALPIQEVNDFPHRSKTQGVSHKCGHDGHTTILAGLARVLEENPIQKGKVYLLFQPAEENGEGAAAMIADEKFEGLKFDEVYALHNLPGYPLHEVVVKEGPFTANVKSLILKLHGKTAHAAEPEHGVNPGLAIANMLLAAEKLTHNVPEDDDFFLITPIYSTLGDTSYGISAGYGELHLTIRSWLPELMDKNCDIYLSYIRKLCEEAGIKLEESWTQVFEANINAPHTVRMVEKTAEQAGMKIQHRKTPFKWGEDFGLFTQRFPGTMFGIGSGEDCPALHNPDYDFPDELIGTGVRMFYGIIVNTLNQE